MSRFMIFVEKEKSIVGNKGSIMFYLAKKEWKRWVILILFLMRTSFRLPHSAWADFGGRMPGSGTYPE